MICLVGFMGAGKSTVGKRLARDLGLRFVDLDHEIELEAGSSIPLLFEAEGEAAFRARESAALQRFCEQQGLVLATGGGCILAPSNQQRLREHGFVLYLEAPVELHWVGNAGHAYNEPGILDQLIGATDRFAAG